MPLELLAGPELRRRQPRSFIWASSLLSADHRCLAWSLRACGACAQSPVPSYLLACVSGESNEDGGELDRRGELR